MSHISTNAITTSRLVAAISSLTPGRRVCISALAGARRSLVQFHPAQARAQHESRLLKSSGQCVCVCVLPLLASASRKRQQETKDGMGPQRHRLPTHINRALLVGSLQAGARSLQICPDVGPELRSTLICVYYIQDRYECSQRGAWLLRHFSSDMPDLVIAPPRLRKRPWHVKDSGFHAKCFCAMV